MGTRKWSIYVMEKLYSWHWIYLKKPSIASNRTVATAFNIFTLFICLFFHAYFHFGILDFDQHASTHATIGRTITRTIIL